MSTTIQQNNTNLQSVLDSVNALEPNSGAGVPDTVTVTIYSDTGAIEQVCYSKVVNGKITTMHESYMYSAELTDVVVGSLIYVYIDVISWDWSFIFNGIPNLLVISHSNNFAYEVYDYFNGLFPLQYSINNPNA